MGLATQASKKARVHLPSIYHIIVRWPCTDVARRIWGTVLRSTVEHRNNVFLYFLSLRPPSLLPRCCSFCTSVFPLKIYNHLGCSSYLAPLLRQRIKRYLHDLFKTRIVFNPRLDSIFLPSLQIPSLCDFLFFSILHAMKTSMVAASVAVEACGCFQRVYHEAEAWAGREHGSFLGARSAWWDVCHLRMISSDCMIQMLEKTSTCAQMSDCSVVDAISTSWTAFVY